MWTSFSIAAQIALGWASFSLFSSTDDVSIVQYSVSAVVGVAKRALLVGGVFAAAVRATATYELLLDGGLASI